MKPCQWPNLYIHTQIHTYNGQGRKLSASPAWQGVALIKVVFFEVALCRDSVHVPIENSCVSKTCLLSAVCQILSSYALECLIAFQGGARFSALFLGREQFGGFSVKFLFSANLLLLFPHLLLLWPHINLTLPFFVFFGRLFVYIFVGFSYGFCFLVVAATGPREHKKQKTKTKKLVSGVFGGRSLAK